MTELVIKQLKKRISKLRPPLSRDDISDLLVIIFSAAVLQAAGILMILSVL